MKKHPILLLPAFLLCLGLACQKPQNETEEKETPVNQETDHQEPVILRLINGETKELSWEAQNFSYTLETNQNEVQTTASAAWITAKYQAPDLKIAILQNDGPRREGTVTIEAGGVSCMLTLIQTEKPKEEEPVHETALDEQGTANCYLVFQTGRYSFDATVPGNGTPVTGVPVPDLTNACQARLVWQTQPGFVSEVTWADGRICFQTEKTGANAVMAALDNEGNILWSWHIWSPGFTLEECPTQSGDVLMHVNLGATSDDFLNDVAVYGLLYQWGRKDPLPGSPVRSEGTTATTGIPLYNMQGENVPVEHSSWTDLKSNTLAYAIAHPTVCLSNYAQYAISPDWLVPEESNDALWGNPKGQERSQGTYPNTGEKTLFDPCPAGWRVPPVRVFQHLTSSGGMIWASGEPYGALAFGDLGGPAQLAAADLNHDGILNLYDYTDGWWLYTHLDTEIVSFFPATTRYDGSYAMFMGSMAGYWGNYWLNAPGGTGRATALSFNIRDLSLNYQITVSPVSNGSRADAYPVRCCKE